MENDIRQIQDDEITFDGTQARMWMGAPRTETLIGSGNFLRKQRIRTLHTGLNTTKYNDDASGREE